MVTNPSYYSFIAFLCVIGYFFWIYPEGMTRVLIFINLKIKHLKIIVMTTYFKWKLLRDLNKFNKQLGLPPIPWNHKKKWWERGLTPPSFCPILDLLNKPTTMDNFDFSQISDQFDFIHECDEEDDWTTAVLGNDEEIIQQLVNRWLITTNWLM